MTVCVGADERIRKRGKEWEGGGIWNAGGGL